MVKIIVFQRDISPNKKEELLVGNLENYNIRVLTNGRHRSIVRKYNGLNRQSLVQIQKMWINFSKFDWKEDRKLEK